MSKSDQISQVKHQVIHPVDSRLRNLNQELLPPTPYLLEVPHGGFKGYAYQANDWRRSCPFRSNEEQLQYMTFRSEFDKDTVLQARGDWDDGKGNITITDKPSGLNTPLPGQLAKKKITLSDYKNKAAGQASVNAIPPAKTNEESKSSLKADNPESISPSQPKAQPKLQHHGVKRSAERLANSPDVDPHASHPHSPPTKKVRLPSNPTPDAQPAKRNTPTVEKPALWDLPPMLSPTLPPDIEEELARMPNEGVSSAQRKALPAARSTAEKKLPSSALTSKEGPLLVKKIAKEVKQKPDQAGREMVTLKDFKLRLAHEKNMKTISNGLTPQTTVNGAVTSKPLMHDVVATEKKSNLSPSAPISTTPKPERKCLVVKFKIPKPIRKNIMRILQMQPRPSQKLGHGTSRTDRNDGVNDLSRGKDLRRATSQESEQQTPKSDQAKAKSTPTINGKKSKVLEDNSNASKLGEKRKRQADQDSTPESSSKRQKHPGGLDLPQKPQTPTRSSMKSPLVSQVNSAQKSQLITPKREMKGTAMHRIGSSEGDVKTPLGSARDGTPTTNGTADHINRDGRLVSSTSGDLGYRNEEIATWRSERKKFEQLGRNLKHESKAALHNDSTSDFRLDTPSLRCGAVIAVETILAFFLAFTIGDEINRLSRLPNDSHAWRTLIPFVRYVEKVTSIYRPLFGLTQQLEAVCRDTISLFEAERLERNAAAGELVDEQRPATATSSENHPSPSGLEKAKADPAVELAENVRQAQLKWQLGHTECSVRELQRSFPETWNKSAELPGPGKGKEKLSPKAYGNGTYYLPLGPSTSAIECVRMGWQMLGEWCKRNDVKWEGKLGL